MINEVVWFGTAVGWAMIARTVVIAAVHMHQKRLHDSEQARMERIARLEIACGVGLKYGAEAVNGTRLASRFADLKTARLREYDGVVERLCWACDESYRPHAHRDWYSGEGSRDPLDETLCPSCLAKARAELDYGVTRQRAWQIVTKAGKA